jgi:hypothetical protein
MTDEYRYYTTAELAAMPAGTLMQWRNCIYHQSSCGDGWVIRDMERNDGTGIGGTYEPHSRLARRKLRRIA